MTQHKGNFFVGCLCGLLSLLCVLLEVGCATSKPDDGRLLMENQQYEDAFAYYEAQAAQHPGDAYYYERKQTARTLAYRVCMARSKDALEQGDLDGFVQNLEAAVTYKPSGSAANILRSIKRARADGYSDAEVLGSMVEGMQDSGWSLPAGEAARLSAQRLARAVEKGSVKTPLWFGGLKPVNVTREQALLLQNRWAKEIERRQITQVDRASLAKIVEEQTLHQTDLVDVETSVEMGRLMGARALLQGDVVRSDNRLVIQLRVTDIETGAITWSDEVRVEH